MNSKYIDDVVAYFGMTKKEAREYCKKADVKTLVAIKKSVAGWGRSSFEND